MKRTISLLIVLTLVMSLLSFSISAETNIQHKYSTSANSGIRHEVCTTLNGTSANQYYTGSYTYEKLSQLDSASLLTTLRTLMTKTHTYKSSYNDCRDMAIYTDCENADGKTVSLIYTSYSATMDDWCNDRTNGWNREHVWPQSQGGFKTSGPGSDLHHVRPSDQPVNSKRGNLKYGNVTGGSTAYAADYTGKLVGGTCNSTYFEPLDNVKGDVARICLYMYVRYGGESSYTCSEIKNVFQSVDVLLEWCALDPVDTWEMGRNEVVGAIQGNRNVFIDYPELAWLLFDEEIPDDIVTPTSSTNSTGSSGSSNSTDPTDSTTTQTQPACTHTSTVTRNDVVATCVDAGYTGDIYCADCGAVITYGSTIAATGVHTFGEWTVALEPTETEDGYKTRTCTVCDHSETETLPATGQESSETAPPVTEDSQSTAEPTQPSETTAPIDETPSNKENLFLFWIPITILLVAGIAVLIFVPKKKEE